MIIFKSIALAFSMFSRIPMPRVEWRKENMRYLLSAFPLVGAVIGLCLYLFGLICDALSLGAFLRGAGLLLLPILITGGIHMDGFADVLDALGSGREAEKKREILKDSHVGAFALLGVCCYCILYFALGAELVWSAQEVIMLAMAPVISRCLSASCSLLLPKYGEEGLLNLFSGSAEKRRSVWIVICQLAIAVAVVAAASPRRGAVVVVAALGCAIWLYRITTKQFHGMSGDLAGWYLQVAELAMLMAIVLTQGGGIL